MLLSHVINFGFTSLLEKEKKEKDRRQVEDGVLVNALTAWSISMHLLIKDFGVFTDTA